MRKFKCILVGDSGCGKTAFMQRHIGGGFSEIGLSTMGADIRPVMFRTTAGIICFEVWDIGCGDWDDLNHLRAQYYKGADCAIIMFDATTPSSMENVNKWYKEISEVAPGAKIVFCGNKIESTVQGNLAQPGEYPFFTFPGSRRKYLGISVRFCQNLVTPFILLANALTDVLQAPESQEPSDTTKLSSSSPSSSVPPSPAADSSSTDSSLPAPLSSSKRA